MNTLKLRQQQADKHSNAPHTQTRQPLHGYDLRIVIDLTSCLLICAGTLCLEKVETQSSYISLTCSGIPWPGSLNQRMPSESNMMQDIALAHALMRVRTHTQTHTNLQVSHRRRPNAEWKLKQAGLFGKTQQLAVEATKPLRKVNGSRLIPGISAACSRNARQVDR